ncbi:MAG: ATP-binding cassette domain-containing protein [Burkholderiales bacterium]|nr:ATP-binding cassette domain-containing protein [Burkholderiales bacterium]
MPLLEAKGLGVRYDKAVILADVTVTVNEGEIVGVVGPNGAGKSTVLRAVSGLIAFERALLRGTRGEIALEGEIRFAGERIDGLEPHEIRRRGLALCPGRQRPFRDLTVLENLMAGAYLSRSAAATRERLERCSALFPRLAERANQLAGTLSGGRAADARDGARAHVRREAPCAG